MTLIDKPATYFPSIEVVDTGGTTVVLLETKPDGGSVTAVVSRERAAARLEEWLRGEKRYGT